jgi:hypothetical protein
MALANREEVFHIVVTREEAELIAEAVKQYGVNGVGESQAKYNILEVLHQVLVVTPKVE